MRTSKLDQKICLVDRSMKINCPKSSFYSQKLVLEMKKNKFQLAVCICVVIRIIIVYSRTGKHYIMIQTCNVNFKKLITKND